MPKDDGEFEVVEEVSAPIRCSQPEGQPEILKISSLSGSPEGGDEIIVIGLFTASNVVIIFSHCFFLTIGKNFNKNCTVIFQSPVYNWKAVAEINQGFFHKEHLVVSTPKFKETELTDNVPVQIRIKSGGNTKYSITSHISTRTKLFPQIRILLTYTRRFLYKYRTFNIGRHCVPC